jgi:hypothetical protein
VLCEPEAARGTGQLPVRCVCPLLTGLRWLATTRAGFSGGLRTGRLSARCRAQHAVDHYVNGEAKPLAGICGDQLGGVGSDERKAVGRQVREAGRDLGSQRTGVGAPQLGLDGGVRHLGREDVGRPRGVLGVEAAGQQDPQEVFDDEELGRATRLFGPSTGLAMLGADPRRCAHRRQPLERRLAAACARADRFPAGRPVEAGLAREGVFLGSKELHVDGPKPAPVKAHCPLGCVG